MMTPAVITAYLRGIRYFVVNEPCTSLHLESTTQGIEISLIPGTFENHASLGDIKRAVLPSNTGSAQ